VIVLVGCNGSPSGGTGGVPSVDKGQKPEAKPPAFVVGGFKIELPKETLQPGEETFPCYIFPIKLEGPSRIVGAGKLTPTVGMHHGNITTRPKTGDGFRKCNPEDNKGFGGEAADITKGGSVLFGSSTQVIHEEWQSFPDGMGYPVNKDFEIVARMHYLNASSKPLEVAPKYEWFTIDESKLAKLLGPFAWSLSGYTIPPLSEHTAASDCGLAKEMNIVTAMPHMHKLGVGFFAEHVGGPLDGARFLDSKGYDPDAGVVVQYDPATKLEGGNRVRFGCKWKNTFNKNIVDGTGDNEMCILFGYAWPYEQAYSAKAAPGESTCVMVAPPPAKY
jgi:hypothetical protein